MNTRPVTVVRVYLREGEHLLEKIVRLLHDEQKVAGVTVQRGLLGFGEDRSVHSAALLDLSLDLPLVLEFFDEPAKASVALEELLQRFDLPHVVSFDASHCRR